MSFFCQFDSIYYDIKKVFFFSKTALYLELNKNCFWTTCCSERWLNIFPRKIDFGCVMLAMAEEERKIITVNLSWWKLIRFVFDCGVSKCAFIWKLFDVVRCLKFLFSMFMRITKLKFVSCLQTSNGLFTPLLCQLMDGIFYRFNVYLSLSLRVIMW